VHYGDFRSLLRLKRFWIVRPGSTQDLGTRPRYALREVRKNDGREPAYTVSSVRAITVSALKTPGAWSGGALTTRRPFQSDQLHVDLWWHGLNLARDAGTYLYTASLLEQRARTDRQLVMVIACVNR